MTPLAPGTGPVGLKEAETIRRLVKADNVVSDEEKAEIRDLLASGRVQRGVVPALELLLNHEPPAVDELTIRNMKLSAVREVTVLLDQARKVTADNGLDEVYFKDHEGKLFVAFQAKGSLNGLKEGHRGHFRNQQVTVLHVDDEINSAAEGAKAPFKSAKSAGQSLITSGATAGITAAVTAAFLGVGNTVVALRTTSSAAGSISLAAAAKAGSTTAGATIATAGVILLAGTALVLGGLSVKEAIAGARRKGDFSTLDMITK